MPVVPSHLRQASSVALSPVPVGMQPTVLSTPLSSPFPSPFPHPYLAPGNLFTVLVVGSIGSYLTHAQEFAFFTAMCLLSMVLLMWVGKSFTYVESCADLAEQDMPRPSAERPTEPVTVPQVRAGGKMFDIEAGEESASPADGLSTTVNLPSI